MTRTDHALTVCGVTYSDVSTYIAQVETIKSEIELLMQVPIAAMPLLACEQS